MAININRIQRPSDRNLFLASAVLFPLLVFIGYFKTYYFSAFFDVKPIANSIVHAHGIVMSLWVIYFTVQIALVRTKNLKLHMTMGFAGIALAALVVVVGLVTAYDSHIVRATAPNGIHPYSFLMIPLGDLLLFVIFFGGAIYYRKRPTEHKSLMLLTAINFLPPALARIPIFPQKYFILWWLGAPSLIAIGSLVWLTVKHRQLNKIFALGVFLLVASYPFRLYFAFTETWLNFVSWFVS